MVRETVAQAFLKLTARSMSQDDDCGKLPLGMTLLPLVTPYFQWIVRLASMVLQQIKVLGN